MGKFKELRVWQESIELAERIYSITRVAPFSKDYGLRDQIQRASVSVYSNIVEGDERGTNREGISFIKHFERFHS